MNNILIVSLHFSPGYIGHMMAWYKLCKQCGYKPLIYGDEQYSKYYDNSEYEFTTKKENLELYKPEYAIVQNTGFENVEFFKWCRKNRCKILYILHEPYMGVKELLKDGTYCIKQAVACILNVWLCKKSERVIVCSQYAEDNCRRYMKGTYKKASRFPLLFMDEYSDEGEERKYFSLVGTFATPKGSDLFLKFIKESVNKGCDINFQIATRTNLDEQLKDETLQQLIRNGKLIVQHGRNMTTDEINAAYRRSICCWNGYRRTTQSGVLPNAYMLGTPVLATMLGSFVEFVVPGKTGEFIDNEDTDSIYNAYLKIREYSEEMSRQCRQYFLDHFFYGNQVKEFISIIDSIQHR